MLKEIASNSKLKCISFYTNLFKGIKINKDKCHERQIHSPERALVKWSQLRLFKAKKRRGYLQRISLYKYLSSAALHRLC